MKSRLLGAVCAYLFSASVNAAVVLFDTTEIVFNAGGSANTIGGDWSADLMSVPVGAEVSFFTIEVKALSVSDGIQDPRTIILSTYFNPNPYGYIALGSEPPFTVTSVGVGSTAVITASTYRSGWELLTHMIEGYREPEINGGDVTMGWPTGGFDVSANGILSIEAYGEAIVPVPPAVWLFGSGLLGLVGMARRSEKNWHIRKCIS